MILENKNSSSFKIATRHGALKLYGIVKDTLITEVRKELLL